MKNKVAIIGSGLVGQGWAILFAKANYEVYLYDQDESKLLSSPREIMYKARELHDAGLIDLNTKNKIKNSIHLSSSLRGAVEGSVYIQESTFENLKTKLPLLNKIDLLSNSNSVIASSTSAILPNELTKAIEKKERFLVVHPVNPPYLIPFVEIVPSMYTSLDIINKTKEIMLEIGQKPVVLQKEVPGFVLNRLQVALVNEAISLVNEGVVTTKDVDTAMVKGLGMRWSFMGPFETIDLNAPGGIYDYLTRFNEMYQIFGDMKMQAPFTEELKELLNKERRDRLAEEEIPERQKWRDKIIMELKKSDLS